MQANPSVIRIRPKRSLDFFDLRQVYENRSLLYHLVKRDLKSLHVNSSLGAFWIVLQPLAMTAVLTLFLGILARTPQEQLPRAVIVLTGLSIWNYYSLSMNRAASSLLANAHLLKKVYFPRILFPLTQICTGLVDLGAILAITIGLCLWFGFLPALSWLFIPASIVLVFFMSLGAGLWIAALNTYFRDIGHILPVTLQLLMYASPVIYTLDMVPQQYRHLYSLNPVVGIIESLRWSLFQQHAFPSFAFAVSIIWTVTLVVSGLFVFRYLEEDFADVV